MIFLFLLTSGTSVYFLAIESQASMIETQEVVNNLQTRKTQENFDVSISTDVQDNNRLAIQIKNQGGFPLEIADFWIINKTDATNEFPVLRYEVNFTEPYIPPGYGADILENYPLYMNPDTYNIKVVSTLGTIHQKEVVVGGPNNLRAELFAIPTDVKVGHNATIAVHVTNIGNSRLLNVQPSNMTIIPTTGVSPPFPSLPNSVTLDPAESTIFSWNYQVDGMAGNNVIFSTNVTASEDVTEFNVTSNNASDEITLREPDVEELIVLTQDLISRPEMFMTIPTPFGVDFAKGIWGMNIVNPTAQSMNVTKLVISAIIPRNIENDLFFPSNCFPENIHPGTGTWTCPTPNQVMWEDPVNPVEVEPFSVTPFLTKAYPGQVFAGNTLEAVVIHGNVFTTAGEFGKAGYGSSMDSANSIANVFLANTPESINNINLLANVSSITSASTVLFNATLADMTPTNTYTIDSANLIINIPKGWTNVSLVSWNGFDNTPSLTTYSDTSTQIKGILSSPITGQAGNDAKTIQFTADAPQVTSTQMYVMYILADGTTGDGYQIGPLSEIILQVIPP